MEDVAPGEGEIAAQRLEMIAVQNQEIESLNQVVRLLKEQVTAGNQEIDALTQKITILEQEVAARNQEITDLNLEMAGLKGEVRTLRQDFASWAGLYKYYQEVITVSHKLIATCYEQLSILPPPPPLLLSEE